MIVKTKPLFVSLAFVMIISTLLPYTTNGNGATFGGEGQIVYPINSKDIELSYEQIYMNLNSEGNIDANCYFHLKNYGPDQEVQIGFPDNRVDWSEEIRTIAVEDFSNGEIPQIIRKDSKEKTYNKVFIWKTKFKSGEMKLLNIKYSFGRFEGSGIPYTTFGYILETGAFWKGSIKKADIYFTFKEKIPRPCLVMTPHNYLYSENRVEWHFTNLEPNFNLEIRLGYSGEENITPEMYYPFQAELDDDYLWDEVFFNHGEFAPGEPEKTNPNYVEWVTYSLKVLPEIRNEIYARHGYIFKDSYWRGFFLKESWYKPDPNFTEAMFNNIEKINIKRITKTEIELQKSLL